MAQIVSRKAPPIVRRLALCAAVLGALLLGLQLLTVPQAGPATAAAERPPLQTPADQLNPSPDPQQLLPQPPSPTSTPSPTPSAAPPKAQVSLVRSACDSVRLAAQTDQGAVLAYRITDEAGHEAAAGRFTGSADLIVPLSTGHAYTASVSQTPDGAALATSAAADLTAPCPVAVTADAPLFSDPCGTDRDAVLVPRIIGVDYRVGETLLVAGTNSALGTVTVVASARPGYSMGGPTQWTHQFSSAPCPDSQQQPLPPTAAAPAPPPAPPSAEPQSSAAPSPAATADHPAGGDWQASTGTPAEHSSQTAASAWAPGPLAWGIMIALAVAGGILFWSKTRH